MSAAPEELLRARPIDAVVIGGSAGAFEALRLILPGLAAADGPAVAIVVHVPQDRSHRLEQVLAQHTPLPMRQAEDKEPFVRGEIVVAPSDYHLLLEPDGTLALSIDPPVMHSRPAIDLLFESAACAYRERLLAVLLSGASEDGAAGLAAVQAQGGICAVQSPDSAVADVMPLAGLRACQAELVLSPEALGACFARRWPAGGAQ